MSGLLAVSLGLSEKYCISATWPLQNRSAMKETAHLCSKGSVGSGSGSGNTFRNIGQGRGIAFILQTTEIKI